MITRSIHIPLFPGYPFEAGEAISQREMVPHASGYAAGGTRFLLIFPESIPLEDNNSFFVNTAFFAGLIEPVLRYTHRTRFPHIQHRQFRTGNVLFDVGGMDEGLRDTFKEMHDFCLPGLSLGILRGNGEIIIRDATAGDRRPPEPYEADPEISQKFHVWMNALYKAVDLVSACNFETQATLAQRNKLFPPKDNKPG